MMASTLIRHKYPIFASLITTCLPPQSLASCVVSSQTMQELMMMQERRSKNSSWIHCWHSPGLPLEWPLSHLHLFLHGMGDTTHDASDCGGRYMVIEDAGIRCLWWIRAHAIICCGDVGGRRGRPSKWLEMKQRVVILYCVLLWMMNDRIYSVDKA